MTALRIITFKKRVNLRHPVDIDVMQISKTDFLPEASPCASQVSRPSASNIIASHLSSTSAIIHTVIPVVIAIAS